MTLPPQSASRSLLFVASLTLLGAAAAGQKRANVSGPPKGAPTINLGCSIPVEPGGGWYSGDTHDHVQECAEEVHPISETLASMSVLSLDVTSPLIWNPGGATSAVPYTEFVCDVTGLPLPGTGKFVVQYGVETSGLDCATWGHLSALNIDAPEARIAIAEDIDDCYMSMTGLGLGCPGGDGTGILVAPVAENFAVSPKAVRGYAHQAWSSEIYSPLGYDWNTNLLLSGFTTDALCLDNAQNLSFPLIFETGQNRRIFPAMSVMDVALGNVEYLETGDMDFDYRFGNASWPESLWYGGWYRMLNAGLRVAPAAGRDTSCEPAGSQLLGTPRTWARVDGALTYDSWTEALGDGHVSVSMGNKQMLDMVIDGVQIGDVVEIESPTSSVNVQVTLHNTCEDTRFSRVEIVQDGVVVDSRTVEVQIGQTSRTVNITVPVTRSGWIAARLQTNAAHTGATYVILDNEPIANCLDAEYWMMWCDRVSKEIADFPTMVFGCQDSQAQMQIADARQLLRTLRDYDFYSGGFEPSWGVTRLGESTGACRGPILIGMDDVPVAGADFNFNCLNAPPNATGLLYLSDTPQAGVCVGNVALYLDPNSTVVAPIPTSSTTAGTAITAVNAAVKALPMGTTIYAQYIWTNPAECPGDGCDGLGSALSASDAVVFTLQ